MQAAANMGDVHLPTWSEFAATINRIKEEHGSLSKRPYHVLFRGVADADYPLETTLERRSSRPWTVPSYAHLTLQCAPQITSFSGRAWNLPTWESLDEMQHNRDDRFHVVIPPSVYSLWIYLRHHGFPSPLLDWTMSPYIAAFFAFTNHRKVDTESVAVFAFIEMPMGGKAGADGMSHITELGPYVETDKRHFLQQACYTICTKHADGAHCFVPHSCNFNRSPSRQVPQDSLFKITIPVSERMTALCALQEMNISRFSLFQTEEALVEALAFDEIDRYEAA